MKLTIYSSQRFFGRYALGSLDHKGRTRPYPPELLRGDPSGFDRVCAGLGGKGSRPIHDCVVAAFAEPWETVCDHWLPISEEIHSAMFAGLDASEFVSAAVLHRTNERCHVHIAVARVHLKTGRPVGLFNCSTSDVALFATLSSLLSLEHGFRDPHDPAQLSLTDHPPKAIPGKHEIWRTLDDLVTSWFAFGRVSDRTTLLAAFAADGIPVTRADGTSITICYDGTEISLRGKKYAHQFRYVADDVCLCASPVGRDSSPDSDGRLRRLHAELPGLIGDRAQRNAKNYGNRPVVARPLTRREWNRYHSGLRPAPLAAVSVRESHSEGQRLGGRLAPGRAGLTPPAKPVDGAGGLPAVGICAGARVVFRGRPAPEPTEAPPVAGVDRSDAARNRGDSGTSTAGALSGEPKTSASWISETAEDWWDSFKKKSLYEYDHIITGAGRDLTTSGGVIEEAVGNIRERSGRIAEGRAAIAGAVRRMGVAMDRIFGADAKHRPQRFGAVAQSNPSAGTSLSSRDAAVGTDACGILSDARTPGTGLASAREFEALSWAIAFPDTGEPSAEVHIDIR